MLPVNSFGGHGDDGDDDDDVALLLVETTGDCEDAQTILRRYDFMVLYILSTRCATDLVLMLIKLWLGRCSCSSLRHPVAPYAAYSPFLIGP